MARRPTSACAAVKRSSDQAGGTLLPVSVESLPDGKSSRPPAESWARPVLEGYRRAFNTPQGPRTLGTVRFADWLHAH